MGKIGAILLTVVIIGVAIYVLNSGILTKGASGLSSLFKLPPTSTTGHGLSPGEATGLQGSTSSPANTNPAGPGGGGNYIPPTDIPPGFTAAQLSPFFHEIRFGFVSGGNNGQLSLNSYLSSNEHVDITGWQIRSNRSGEFIPQAVLLYDPSGLAAQADIRLGQGDFVNIYPNSAPTNLRLNKCLGYIQQSVNQFNPPLPSACPNIDRSEIQSFSGACQNYILSLGTCQTGDPGSPRIPRNDYACQTYVNDNFNYRACFEKHESEADFLSHEVRVWMGANPLDQFHDRALLLDNSGLLVDMYNY